MQFNTILGDLAAKIKRRRVRRKTSAHLQDYFHSERVRLSKVFAYRMVDEKAEIVPDEAAIVKIVFQRLTEGRSLPEIKIELDCKGMKTRFGNRWSVGMIRHLVRPLYASLIVGKHGEYIKSSIYPPLVSKDTYEKAKKAVGMAEALDFDPAKLLLGGRD